MAEPGVEDAIALAERILSLLDQGAFTATYKYAVLLGLLDLCLENTARTGAPPTSLTTRQLAEKVVELYWPQVTPHGAGAPRPPIPRATAAASTPSSGR